MHKAGETESILSEVSKYGTVYSSVVSRQNAYAFEAFVRHAFVASPSPVATAAADWPCVRKWHGDSADNVGWFASWHVGYYGLLDQSNRCEYY